MSLLYRESVKVSAAQSCPTLCDPVACCTPSLPVGHQLPELTHLTSTESGMPSTHVTLSSPSLPPSTIPSIGFFHIKWPKYCSFSFSISPSSEHPGLSSFRMDWLALLAVQGTLKSLLQHHSSKASVLSCSAFSIVQLSHPYMTSGKTVALTRRTFVGKAMALLFNMLSRLVIAFLPRSRRPLTSRLRSP